MSPQKQHVMHGRDHKHGGADPLQIAYEDVGTGGGGAAGAGIPWALATNFETGIAANPTGPTYFFDCLDFYTNDLATFDSNLTSAKHGIRILRAGAYRVGFSVKLFRASQATPASTQAQLFWSGGGVDFTESTFSAGELAAVGERHPPFSGADAQYELSAEEPS
jgi:hypothetical protein